MSGDVCFPVAIAEGVQVDEEGEMGAVSMLTGHGNRNSETCVGLDGFQREKQMHRMTHVECNHRTEQRVADVGHLPYDGCVPGCPPSPFKCQCIIPGFHFSVCSRLRRTLTLHHCQTTSWNGDLLSMA